MWSRGSPRRGGVENKNLPQIKCRTFSDPTVTHELTHTVPVHMTSHISIQYTSHEGTPKAVFLATALQGWVKGINVKHLKTAREALYLCSHTHTHTCQHYTLNSPRYDRDGGDVGRGVVKDISKNHLRLKTSK